MKDLVRILKCIQISVSIFAIVLIWLVYPGVLALLATLVAICYLAASLFAAADKRVGIWFAFVFTALTATLSILGTGRFVSNGYSFSSGSFQSSSELYPAPYLFLLISIAATLVVALHLVCWRWAISGRKPNLV